MKKIGYLVEKAFGPIKENLKDFYVESRTLYSEDIMNQIANRITEIFEEIKVAFSDKSSENNVICELNPDLEDIRIAIGHLNNDIKELDNKKRRIKGELERLGEIFSATN